MCGHSKGGAIGKVCFELCGDNRRRARLSLDFLGYVKMGNTSTDVGGRNPSSRVKSTSAPPPFEYFSCLLLE